jgi:hypothetical protein
MLPGLRRDSALPFAKRESPVLSAHREFLPEPSDNGPMTPEQAATLKRLAQAAYELDAFKTNLKQTA